MGDENILWDDRLQFKLLFIDAETTGFIEKTEIVKHSHADGPHLLQVSWIITNLNGDIISQNDFLVKPTNFSLPEDLFEMHNNKFQKAKQIGKSKEYILRGLQEALKQSNAIIGHNVIFDTEILQLEFDRLGIKSCLDEKLTCCTMMIGSSIFNNTGYRFPSLTDLSIKLLNKELIKRNNSIENVQTIMNCFWKLRDIGVIKI